MNKQTVHDIDVFGKRVIVRADFNVPLDKNLRITDDARIVKTLPTIRLLMEKGAKVVLMSHLGRPKGKPEAEFSLKPVAERLSQLIKRPVSLQIDCMGASVETAIKSLQNGDVTLLENLRFHAEEEKNDARFAKALSSLADIYVNDAFGAAHRAHASTEGITKYLPSAAGLLLAREVEYFDRALENPERPFVTILGGAKVSDKIKVIENLLTKVNALLIGGAMAYTFLKSLGKQVGNSKVDEPGVEIAKGILEKARERRVKLMLPVDHIITQAISEKSQPKICEVDIPDGWIGVDIGPKTIEQYCRELQKAKTVVWNGPVGIFEMKPFSQGTQKLAETLSALNATTIIGGGDTAAAVKEMGFEEKMSHVSTGGGASLEYLEGNGLPGIAALTNKRTAKV